MRAERRDGGGQRWRETRGDNEGREEENHILSAQTSPRSKCTPTISILTPPPSSALLPPHYHQAWSAGCRKHKLSSFPITCSPKCHAADEMRTNGVSALVQMSMLVLDTQGLNLGALS